MSAVTEPIQSETKLDSVKLLGLLAEFDDPHQVIDAGSALREQGYKLEAYSPFPIHGIDEALGIRRTKLPWAVLIMALLGGSGILYFQYWTNAVDYPFMISGKPLFGLPANIPVTFEVIILSAALTTFFGVLGLCRLPTLSNPLFNSDRFRRVTDDGFFLLVQPGEARFSDEERARLEDKLSGLGAISTEQIFVDTAPVKLPITLKYGIAVLVAILLIPPAMVASVRGTKSDQPRIHPIIDMDVQAKGKPQATSPFFADGRVMRPTVPGTIAWGNLQEDDAFHRGIKSSDEPPAVAARAVAFEDPADSAPAGSTESNGSQPAVDAAVPAVEAAADDQPDAEKPAVEEPAEPDWVTKLPIEASSSLMLRGQQRYNIYCATCHGLSGEGNGLIALRAQQLEQPTWVPPTSLHTEYVRQQPVGKLFHVITHGVRKMPAYGSQIPPEDRWAIVLYVRALQRSRAASLQDVPENVRPHLETTK